MYDFNRQKCSASESNKKHVGPYSLGDSVKGHAVEYVAMVMMVVYSTWNSMADENLSINRDILLDTCEDVLVDIFATNAGAMVSIDGVVL